jgi:hypothetical protein
MEKIVVSQSPLSIPPHVPGPSPFCRERCARDLNDQTRRSGSGKSTGTNATESLLKEYINAAAARKNLAIDAETAYEIAYEAMIKGSLALMLSHGQRPRKQLGHHHIAIIEFAQNI